MSKKPDYLTLCSIAAQKAGTSYGKYMATDTTRQFRPMWRTWKPRRAFLKSAHSAGRNLRRARSSRKFIAVWSARKPTPREPLKGDTAIEKGEQTMIKLTQSLQQYLFVNHREIIVPLMFGHTEVLTQEIWDAYIEWCKTDEGHKYLKGGEKYVEESECEGQET